MFDPERYARKMLHLSRRIKAVASRVLPYPDSEFWHDACLRVANSLQEASRLLAIHEIALAIEEFDDYFEEAMQYLLENYDGAKYEDIVTGIDSLLKDLTTDIDRMT